MNNRTTILIFVITGLCLVLGVVGVVLIRNYVPDITGPTGADNSAKAQIRCDEVIRASLRSPDRANFRSHNTISLGGDKYQVTGTIDAPNATGVVVRGNFICTFNFNTKSFDLLSLEGDDIWKPLKK
jgi:hypothetical protein